MNSEVSSSFYIKGEVRIVFAVISVSFGIYALIDLIDFRISPVSFYLAIAASLVCGFLYFWGTSYRLQIGSDRLHISQGEFPFTKKREILYSQIEKAYVPNFKPIVFIKLKEVDRPIELLNYENQFFWKEQGDILSKNEGNFTIFKSNVPKFVVEIIKSKLEIA